LLFRRLQGERKPAITEMARANTQQLLDQIQQDIEALNTELFKLRGVPDPDDKEAKDRVAHQAQPVSTVVSRSTYKPVQLSLKPRLALKGHFDKVYSLMWSFDKDAKRLVSASQDGRLLFWNAISTNKIGSISLRSSWVMTCAYSPSSNLVASGGLDNVCTIYKVDNPPFKTHESKVYKDLNFHEGYISSCRFIDDTKIVTGSGDSKAVLWDIEKAAPICIFKGHLADVACVAVPIALPGYQNQGPAQSPSTFLSSACDNTAKLWDFRANQGKSVMTFLGHESDVNSIEYFPDGNAFVTGSDDSTCRLFDLRALRQLQKYGDPKILCGISSVACSTSGRFIFGGYDDYSCYAWDTLTGEKAAELKSHLNRVSCLGVSRDGYVLATGSWDTNINIWV